jgi:Fe-S-cluster containining protein
MRTAPQEPFYTSGLRFTCRQCHNCCRGGQPGWVYPSQREIATIARRLKLSPASFRRRFLVKDEDGEASFRMHANGDCVFWDQGCTIYPVRPRQCRTYPFWPENLESPETWEEVKRTCHGAGHGKLYRLNDVRSILRGRPTSRSSKRKK